MKRNIVNKQTADDMLADLDVSDAEKAALRAILDDVAALASEVPEPSVEVRALLGGAVPLRPRRRAVIVATAAGALALGGVSAAAAANRLPDPIQEIVADASEGVLPVDVPHPAKPTKPIKPANSPYDAPGHLKNTPKAPKPAPTTAPGQVQKSTKPDPKAPGPARPADPGSFGRAHHPDATPSDVPRGSRESADSATPVNSSSAKREQGAEKSEKG